MNHPCPLIQNSFTQQDIQRKKLMVQTMLAFVGEQDYDRLHIDDDFLDNEG
jgi:hypothetical protein